MELFLLLIGFLIGFIVCVNIMPDSYKKVQTGDDGVKRCFIDGKFYELVEIAKQVSLFDQQGRYVENPDCHCRMCNPTLSRMILCPDCGNKRCPHALDHSHQCTGSNEPNQTPNPIAGEEK